MRKNLLSDSMDRAIPVMNQILHDKWIEKDKIKQKQALEEIK